MFLYHVSTLCRLPHVTSREDAALAMGQFGKLKYIWRKKS